MRPTNHPIKFSVKSEPEKLRVSYNSLNNILAPDDNWKYNTGRQRISVSNIIISYNLQQF